ncbi:DUF692 family multinuclear iron-containing protein [Pleionea sp. CnH1-48]|uniref:MNIO family bufferin maturase n=1 Tax=Pleionea sp. CnH1-48 TaxID=2954494 RepID=UPI0020976AC6|nr:DUF692 domain-containing protein [Pleionea sp. CnH1-48]
MSLKEAHLDAIVKQQHPVQWFELMVDNWMAQGGFVKAALSGISQTYPVTLHGVGLSLGSIDPLNINYLKQVKSLIKLTGARWYSEHCSFSSFHEQRVPDLLPLPYTQEALNHISSRIHYVQDYLRQPLLIENVSSYIVCDHNEMDEADFLAELTRKTDCYLLLDINNVYVSASNHQFCARDYINRLPVDRIRQLHLAGYHQQGDWLIDSHSAEPSKAVWQLYEYFLAQHSTDVATLIEWDNRVPDFDELVAVQQRATRIQQQAKAAKDIGLEVVA